MHKTVLAALLACAHALRPPARLAPLRTRSAARASLLRATPADADKCRRGHRPSCSQNGLVQADRARDAAGE